MLNKICGFLAVIAILIILCSGILADLFKFLSWLFFLKYTAPETSVVGGIIVRVLTFIVSFGLVGVIFGLFGLFDKKTMSIFYSIISTILGFVFSYLIWKIEEHMLIIGIVLGIALLVVVTVFVVLYFAGKKSTTPANNNKND